MIYNIFGSENSYDYDIMVYVDSLPSIQECKELCKDLELGYDLEIGHDKKRNVNLAVLSEGKIVDVFKGSPDECNNSVFQTYHLHEKEGHWNLQAHPLQVNGMVDRDVELKLARGLRVILSFLSRTSYRKFVKSALKGTTSDKLFVLENIILADIKDLNKNVSITEFYKTVAFQIVQCMALMEGIEIYTKGDACYYCTPLSDYLYRFPCSGHELDVQKQNLIDLIRKSYSDVDIIKE